MLHYSCDDDYERTLSEDHYQHYYSYYYNLRPNIAKLSHKQDRGRKLPTALNMPFQKNSLISGKLLHTTYICMYVCMVDKKRYVYKLIVISERSGSGEYGSHVLKEKSINNNEVLPYEKDNWDYDSFKVIGGSGSYAKDMETHECENSKYYDDSRHLYKVKQTTMISHFSPDSDNEDIEEGVNVSNNNYDEQHDQQLSSEEDDELTDKYSGKMSKISK